MSSPINKSPPPDGNHNLGPAVMAVYWTQIALCTIVIALRFWARRINKNIGWDDWLMLVSQILFVASGALATAQNAVGGYRHTYYLSEQEIVTALKLNFILRSVVIIAYIPSKAAVGVLILRVTRRRKMWQQKVVWVVIIFTTLLNALNSIFNFVQCSPVDANWTPALKESATCWPDTAQLDFAYFQCVENVVADAVLALLPITFFIKMKLPLWKKVSSCVLMGLGLMATVCGSIKTYELGSIGVSLDFTWNEYGLTVWAASELFVIIVCGSVPALGPLQRKLFPDRKSKACYYDYDHSSRAIKLAENIGTFESSLGSRDMKSETAVASEVRQASQLTEAGEDASSPGILVTKDISVTTTK